MMRSHHMMSVDKSYLIHSQLEMIQAIFSGKVSFFHNLLREMFDNPVAKNIIDSTARGFDKGASLILSVGSSLQAKMDESGMSRKVT